MKHLKFENCNILFLEISVESDLTFLCYFQTAILLLRIDDIVSGTKKHSGDGASSSKPVEEPAQPAGGDGD